MWALGVLFGLYDYRFEVLGLLMHAAAPGGRPSGWARTPSPCPGIRPAAGVVLQDFPHLVSDDDFKKVIAVLRLAVPYTGMMHDHPRAPPATATSCSQLGISPDQRRLLHRGWGLPPTRRQQDRENTAQFEVNDTRSPQD